MKLRNKFIFLFLAIITVLLTAILCSYGMDSVMLNPKGLIALKERNLMIAATILMLLVVIPVLILTAFVCLVYRASNKRARYEPNWDYNFWAELAWWTIPFFIITFLSVITWRSSFDLDPFKPIESNVRPLRIQAVALDWKWLFIYPDQKIATINYLQIPVHTPINFEITADAPMNSLWIPQLAGQVYAMPGMTTKLHLVADVKGSYRGCSANISGEGFSGMSFVTIASTEDDFNTWVNTVKQSQSTLDNIQYQNLVKPSQYNPVACYVLKDQNLFDAIIMKFMMPPSNSCNKCAHEIEDHGNVNTNISTP